jgi:hypothetical protein
MKGQVFFFFFLMGPDEGNESGKGSEILSTAGRPSEGQLGTVCFII